MLYAYNNCYFDILLYDTMTVIRFKARLNCPNTFYGHRLLKQDVCVDHHRQTSDTTENHTPLQNVPVERAR